MFIVFLMEKTDRTLRVVARISSPLPKKVQQLIDRIMRSFLAGFEIFRQTHHYAAIITQSMLLWVLYAGIIYVTFMAFNLTLESSTILIASLVILVMISIGIMIPSSPGFVGTFHYLCMQGLFLFGVSENDALSFAIILHAGNYIPITLVGLYFFWRENLHLSDVKQVSEKKTAPATGEPMPYNPLEEKPHE